MATLYVENVPSELYDALREQARQHRKSIAAEVLSLLEENIPTAQEIKSRQRFLRRIQHLQSRSPRRAVRFASTEQMQAEDRYR